jgi:hypothetical protein
MFSNLLKKDLHRNMRWLWVLFVATLVMAVLNRGCKELAKQVMFFQILGIFVDTLFYSAMVNGIVQPFLRNFMNFAKSFYGDEAYLTHTLPVTKTQLVTSKFLTALIEITLGFVVAVASLLIVFWTPDMFDFLQGLIFLLVGTKLSAVLVLALFVGLVLVEFLMFIAIILFAIVVAYRAKEKRVLKTFLYTCVMAFVAITILSVAMVVVLAINGIDLSSSTLVMTGPALLGLLGTGIAVYSLIAVGVYFLTKHEFNKGVNVD